MSATMYIDGAWVAAKNGGERDITCPADGEFVGTVAAAEEVDTVLAIEAAQRAYDWGVWANTPARERGDFLLRAAALLRKRREEFARPESLDTGKRIVESRIDKDDIAACLDYFGRIADQDAGRVVDPGSQDVVSRIEYEPVGVCALITPWNYPLLQAMWKIAPALAAGDSLVLKPAELTPHTAILF